MLANARGTVRVEHYLLTNSTAGTDLGRTGAVEAPSGAQRPSSVTGSSAGVLLFTVVLC